MGFNFSVRIKLLIILGLTVGGLLLSSAVTLSLGGAGQDRTVLYTVLGAIVLVGGAPLNEEFAKAVGADAYCRDAAVAVETAKAMMARKHNQMAAT